MRIRRSQLTLFRQRALFKQLALFNWRHLVRSLYHSFCVRQRSLWSRRWALCRALLFVTAALAGALASASAAEVITVAGTGRLELGGDGGPLSQAGVGEPYGLTIGPDGALYVCEIKEIGRAHV